MSILGGKIQSINSKGKNGDGIWGPAWGVRVIIGGPAFKQSGFVDSLSAKVSKPVIAMVPGGIGTTFQIRHPAPHGPAKKQKKKNGTG